MELHRDMQYGDRGAWISIIAYICLSVLKAGAGYWFHSDALLADGLNNTTDIVASVAILIGLKISRRPPDHDHRYGHSRAETIASLIASFIMATVGIQVLYNAVHTFVAREYTKPDLITAWIALFGAAVMFGVFAYNIRLAKRINSQAIKAAAMDNRSDALVSIGAFVGIIGAQLGWTWLDPAAAFGVGIIICKTAVDIFRETTHALTDGFDERELKKYRRTIEAVPGVAKVVDIKARAHGNQVLMDVTIHVNPALSVAQSHDISDHIEGRMQSEHRIDHVHIHVEPSRRP